MFKAASEPKVRPILRNSLWIAIIAILVDAFIARSHTQSINARSRQAECIRIRHALTFALVRKSQHSGGNAAGVVASVLSEVSDRNPLDQSKRAFVQGSNSLSPAFVPRHDLAPCQVSVDAVGADTVVVSQAENAWLAGTKFRTYSINLRDR